MNHPNPIELFLPKRYEVYGMVQLSRTFNTSRWSIVMSGPISHTIAMRVQRLSKCCQVCSWPVSHAISTIRLERTTRRCHEVYPTLKKLQRHSHPRRVGAGIVEASLVSTEILEDRPDRPNRRDRQNRPDLPNKQNKRDKPDEPNSGAVTT